MKQGEQDSEEENKGKREKTLLQFKKYIIDIDFDESKDARAMLKSNLKSKTGGSLVGMKRARFG